MFISVTNDKSGDYITKQRSWVSEIRRSFSLGTAIFDPWLVPSYRYIYFFRIMPNYTFSNEPCRAKRNLMKSNGVIKADPRQYGTRMNIGQGRHFCRKCTYMFGPFKTDKRKHVAEFPAKQAQRRYTMFAQWCAY